MKPMRRLAACSSYWSARGMTTETALELLHAGNPAGALALLGEAISPDDNDPARLAVLGMVQLANHHHAEALAALRLAAAVGDTAPVTLLNLALAELQAGDQAGALRRMEALERRLPDWDEPPLRLAEAHRAADRPHDAELAYGRALAINPRREAALLGLAGLLIMRGEGATARDLLLRCCGVAPGRADAWDTLGSRCC
jgi:protein O-GlcNAc transferase